MINLILINRHADNIKRLDEKYNKPMAEYMVKIKAKYGNSPTPDQEKDLAIQGAKAELLDAIVSNGHMVNSMLAVCHQYITDLETVLNSKRILKDGKIREALVAEQREELINVIDKLLSLTRKN
jgi:hypothetical protein